MLAVNEFDERQLTLQTNNALHKAWRFFLGAYLLYSFIQIFPFRIEMYGDQGVFKNHALVPWLSYFPSFLLSFDRDAVLILFFGVGFVASTSLALGFAVRLQAFTLWFIATWMANRNPFSDSPEYAFVSWLLVGICFVPSIEQSEARWNNLKGLKFAAWITLAASYVYAAIMKIALGDPSWIRGDAVYLMLTQDNSRRAWYGDFIQMIPPPVFYPITFFILALQLSGPLLIPFRRTRLAWWIGVTGMHVVALFVANLNQLTLGMLVFHLFLFDSNWLSSKLSSKLVNLVSRFLPATKSIF